MKNETHKWMKAASVLTLLSFTLVGCSGGSTEGTADNSFSTPNTSRSITSSPQSSNSPTPIPSVQPPFGSNNDKSSDSDVAATEAAAEGVDQELSDLLDEKFGELAAQLEGQNEKLNQIEDDVGFDFARDLLPALGVGAAALIGGGMMLNNQTEKIVNPAEDTALGQTVARTENIEKGVAANLALGADTNTVAKNTNTVAKATGAVVAEHYDNAQKFWQAMNTATNNLQRSVDGNAEALSDIGVQLTNIDFDYFQEQVTNELNKATTNINGRIDATALQNNEVLQGAIRKATEATLENAGMTPDARDARQQELITTLTNSFMSALDLTAIFAASEGLVKREDYTQLVSELLENFDKTMVLSQHMASINEGLRTDANEGWTQMNDEMKQLQDRRKQILENLRNE